MKLLDSAVFSNIIQIVLMNCKIYCFNIIISKDLRYSPSMFIYYLLIACGLLFIPKTFLFVLKSPNQTNVFIMLCG